MFDFASTNRKLCIFIPNFGRGDYIRKTLSQFSTEVDSDDYVIVIGNDGIVEDFSDLREYRVQFFTIDRGNSPVARNGGFIRNYFIKRCQSEIILQKDPETILYNVYENSDWILNVMRLTSEWSIYRPGYTQELDKNLSDKFYHSKDLNLLNANRWLIQRDTLECTGLMRLLQGILSKYVDTAKSLPNMARKTWICTQD